MKIIDILEAPIEDFTLRGEFNPEKQSSFGTVDKKIITKPTYEKRIRDAFKNTPYKIDIYYIDDDKLKHPGLQRWHKKDDHKYVRGDNIEQNDDPGVLDVEYADVQAKKVFGVTPKKDTISIAAITNISPMEAKLPLTPWIIAHKLFHAVQSSDLKKYGSVRKTLYTLLDTSIQQYHMKKEDEEGYSVFDSGHTYPHWYQANLTMASARNNQFLQDDDDITEIAAELFAQFMLTGKAITKEDPKLEKRINTIFDRILKSMIGKVVVIV